MVNIVGNVIYPGQPYSVVHNIHYHAQKYCATLVTVIMPPWYPPPSPRLEVSQMHTVFNPTENYNLQHWPLMLNILGS